MMCLNIGHIKSINFPFRTNGKFIDLGVPILKHFSGRSTTSIKNEHGIPVLATTFAMHRFLHFQKTSWGKTLVISRFKFHPTNL